MDGNTKEYLDSFLSVEKIEKLEKYASLVMEYNEHTNITGSKDFDSFFMDHVMDSIIAHEYFAKYKKVLDVGSGSGIPSIPLAIIFDKIHFTLCESKSRKCNFLVSLKDELNLKNIEVLCKNVYEIKDKYYDVITAKAFSDLQTLVKVLNTVGKRKTIILAYKGKLDKIEDEIYDIKALNKYEINVEKLYSYDETIERNLVMIKNVNFQKY